MPLHELLLRLEQRTIAAYQLAQLLGVAELTIYRQAAKGIIPSIKIGVALRFDTVAVAQWLKGQGAA